MSFFSYPKPTSWYGDTVIRRCLQIMIKVEISNYFEKKFGDIVENV